MLQELNRRLESLSYCKLRMFQDPSGMVWLEDLHAAPLTEPIRIGSLSDAAGYVEAMEKAERMAAVMN
jgi:hypothetical protein